MHTALKLDVKVTLMPYVWDVEVEWGRLVDKDVCIRNILENPVKSEKAICGQDSDKKDIHESILKESPPRGFELIDKSVKRIRLEYLLQYPVENIKGYPDDSEAEKKESRRDAVQTLASSIIIMVERVHSLKDEIPEFKEYLNKKSEDSSEDSSEINTFREWKQIVDNHIIEEKMQNKRFSIKHLLGNCCRGLGTSTRSE